MQQLWVHGKVLNHCAYHLSTVTPNAEALLPSFGIFLSWGCLNIDSYFCRHHTFVNFGKSVNALRFQVLYAQMN